MPLLPLSVVGRWMYVYLLKTPPGKFRTSTCLGMSAIYSLLLLEIKSHKQTWHIKDAVKQKGLSHKAPASCTRTFSKTLFLVTEKKRLRVEAKKAKLHRTRYVCEYQHMRALFK